uniref:Uncharacterized protein n=1 Tax=candidate division CPR3 bacterium TaxID=2268181 RepID=A0A7V3N6F2_UNCC3
MNTSLGKGSILFHKQFKFKNGDIGEKLIIILNNPNPSNEPYLVCRTTSQEKNKPKIFGCHEELSLFYLPSGHDFFEKDTWIQLHEIFPFEASTLLKDFFDRELECLGKLKDLTIRQLMNCVKKIRDISLKHKKLILRD